MDLETSSYLFGTGTMAFAWASTWATPRVWRIRQRRQQERRQERAALERVRLMSDPLFYEWWMKARAEISTLEADADIPPDEFSLQSGWIGSACGRGICAKGHGHLPPCDF